ncbi:MAG: beta-propeller fold lactonase family protein [Chitinophagaceae bacterium]|nr:beta-propeller fold lactonase family protein [Chitinophagaceae bacterium]
MRIFLLLAWLSLSASSLSQNLVAYYPFNGNANDAIGNIHSGIVAGASLTSDRFSNNNRAYNFNGSSDYIEITSANTLRLPEYTYSAWIYPTANPPGGPIQTGGATILGIGGNIGDQVLNIGNFIGTYIGIGGFGYYLGGGTYNTQTGVLPAINQWYHVVGTRSTTHYKLYINGMLIQSVPLSPIAPEYDVSTVGYIGKRIGDFQYFNGKLDDIRIYDAALSDAQVQNLYASESLVAYFPFNGNAIDESGNGNNSTYLGTGVTLTTDRFGNANKAYHFDGAVGSYIRVPAGNFPTTDRTVSFWFNAERLDYYLPTPFSYGGNVCNDNFITVLNHYSWPNTYTVIAHCATNRISAPYVTEPINNWYHFTATISGSTQKIYINGVLQQTENTFITPTYVTGTSALMGAMVNTDGNSIFAGYFQGKLDEFRIYNSALTDAQILQLYNNESTGLVAYYPFNGNANDESGFGRHGTVTNGAVLTTDRFGNANSAYDFDGINDYIDISATGLPETNRTVMFWLNPATGNQPSYPLTYGGNGCGTSYLMGFNASNSNRYNTQGHCNTNALSSPSWSVNPENQWAHFAVTINGTTIKIFINGVESNSNNGFSVPTFVDVRKLFIGALITPDGLSTYIDGSGGYFKGKLDDIKIYNRALSNEQVADEYSSMVAFYPFNGNANDQSGNNINPVYNGAVLTADRFGTPNKAYYFDGTSNSYIKVPADLFPTTNRTIAFWFNADEVVSGPTLFSYGGNGSCGASTFLMGLNVTGLGGYVCEGHCNVNQSVYIYPTPPINSWKHWVISVDGATIKMYLNGVLVKTDNVYSGATYVSGRFAAFGGLMYIDGLNPYTEFYRGKLDEIRVYKKVLSDAEIAALFASESPLPDALAIPSSQTTCSGSAITTILITGSVPSTVFNWTRDNTSTVTGIAASGAGDISGTLTNTTTAPVLVTFTITPTAGGNTGTPITATVLVKPVPDLIVPSSQTFCNGTLLPAGTFNFMANGYNGSSARILILTAEFVNPVNLRNQLLAMPGVTNVDLYDATVGTPTLSQLQQYNVVVAFSNTNWNNNVAIGDVLADYMDAGGTVAAFNFNWMGGGRSIKGRWLTGGYSPFNDDALTNYTSASLGTFNPVHPLMQGVTSLNAFYRFIVALAPGATQVAAWSDGNILLANKGRAVAVNAYTGDNAGASWSGDYARLIVNAGNWLNGTTIVTWTNNNTSIGLAASGTGNTLPAFTATNTTPAPVMATITVTPSSGTSGGFAYIPNMGSGNVSVINTATNNVVTTIPVGSNPRGVSVSADGSRAYIANNGSSTVSVINTSTQSVIATIPITSSPLGLVVNPDGTRLYVVSNGLSQVDVVNTSTNAIIANIPCGSGAWADAISPDGSRLYVSNYGGSSVTVINTATNTVVTTIGVQTNPIGLKVSPDGSKLYVVNQGSGTMSVINTATNSVITTIPVGSLPNDVAVSADGSRVYSVNQGSDNVTVINAATNTVITSVTVGSNPVGISLQPDGSRAYTANYADNNVSVINTATNTVITTVPVQTHPYAIGNFVTGSAVCTGASKTFTITVNPSPEVTQPANQTVCNNSATAAINFTGSGTVFNWTNNNTTIGLAASGTGNIPSFTATNATASPVTATVTVTPSAGGSYAYIANRNSNNVVVINTATNLVVATVAVGANPWGVSVSPDGNQVYVANQNSNNISVINTTTNTVVATVAVGSSPLGVSVSPDGSRIYVVNSGSDDVSVINTTTNMVVATVPVGSNPMQYQ